MLHRSVTGRHELDGGTGDDQPNPAAFREYWKDYLEFNKTSLQQAPAEIRDEWIVSDRAIRTVLTPVLEKYDFDVQRIAKEGTAAEKALGEPTREAQKAQDAIHAYEDRVCGVATPAAADVAFVADSSSKAYCTTLSTLKRGFEEVESSRFDPQTMRTVFTADSFTESLDSLEESAPSDIAADQEAVSEWFRTRWSDVIGEFDYDIRRIWLDGTPEDRAVFTLSIRTSSSMNRDSRPTRRRSAPDSRFHTAGSLYSCGCSASVLVVAARLSGGSWWATSPASRVQRGTRAGRGGADAEGDVRRGWPNWGETDTKSAPCESRIEANVCRRSRSGAS